MKLKIILNTIFLLISFSAVSAEIYEGVVERQIQGNKIILISGGQYFIDHTSIIRGMVKRGETGPVFDVGTKLGFKLDESNAGKIKHISEGWVLK
ncbi:MAG: hypothetical protein KUG64_09555 [Cycloclasticus sp.]|nr:hypothetical protein [Cycloclasticus sp.]